MRLLNACLASLHVQRQPPGQILVACNSIEASVNESCKGISELYNALMVPTGRAGALNCYQAADRCTGMLTQEWVCFPSDDSLYVFDFSTIMLETAQKTGADLIYCDCVYRQDPEKGKWPAYSVLETTPRMGRIDKTNFILRRSLFKGFPSHHQGYQDGALIEQVLRAGGKAAKAPGVLVVHQ